MMNLLMKTHIEGVPVVPASKIADEFDPKDYQAHVALSYRNMNKNREAKYNLLKSLILDWQIMFLPICRTT